MEKHGRTTQATDDNIIRRMGFACWVKKVTDKHPEYVILIVFPWQQYLRDPFYCYFYTYSVCLVIVKLCFGYSNHCA